jgi:hypothetical protein
MFEGARDAGARDAGVRGAIAFNQNIHDWDVTSVRTM